MGFFFERYLNGELAGVGTENGVFANDLKTVRGVKNRILNGVFLAGEWVIYRFSNALNDETYVEVGRVTKR